MNSTLEAAYIGVGGAVLAAIIVGILTYLKRENSSQSTQAKGNGQAISSSGSGNAVNAGGNVHIGDIVAAPLTAIPATAAPGANAYHNPKSGYSSKPTPQEIIRNIKNHPPFQRDDIIRQYVGLLVRWEISLLNTDSLKNDVVDLTCYYGDTNPYIGISFSASLTQYPRLKITNEGGTLWVSGKVKKIVSYIIYLEDVSLDFDDQ